MKTKYLVGFIIISAIAIIGSAVLFSKVAFTQEATGIANIQYPVKELNSCQNETACKNYCDKPENIKACVAFAENNNLMSKEDIELAKKFVAVGAKGPGGCDGKDSCEDYCDDISRIDECVAFAEKNNLMPKEELAEAKKVQAAIKRGVKPPLCGNKKQCDVYCNETDHMEECVAFGAEAGFIQGKELEDAQKMLAALKRGVRPPPCRGRKECDEYCSAPDNMEMCMNFAIEAGFMGEQEKAESQKMLAALKKGIKPPACRGRKECDDYCSQDDHFEECFQFAEAAGFMSAEEAAMARKTGGKGPGNCKGKEECETFCNNPDNQETCFNFGKEHGMIPEKDLKMMEEGKQRFKESMTQMPPEVADCLKSLVGEEKIEKIKSGTAMPSREIGDQMKTCFEKMGPPPGSGEPGAEGMMRGPGQTGPGGCRTPEECQKFQPGPGGMNPGNQMMPQQAGPGGCKGPEECRAYCESHLDECKNFGSGGSQQLMPGAMPSGQEGQPGGFPPTGPDGCKTQEECQQKIQLQMQLQMQNQMMMPLNQPSEQLPIAPTPPPPSDEMSPPSGFLGPQSLLGLMLFIFTKAFQP